MLLELNVVEGPYLQDILSQPEALRQSLLGFDENPGLLDFASRITAGHYDRIVLTGMGSSLYALYPLHLKLTNAGHASLLAETSELIHYLNAVLGPRTLVIAVSQSGESAEIVRLLEIAKGRSPVIGITNDADSLLARSSDAAVLTRAGAESSVSCKTYVASLMALEWLAALLLRADLPQTRDLLHEAIAPVQSYLADWRQHVASLRDIVQGISQIVVAGRGPSLATAQTGGLILKESTRLSAEGMSCPAFRHGPFEMVAPHVFVLILAGDGHSRPLNARLADDIKGAGGNVATVDVDAEFPVFRIPPLPDATRPILEILPVQMLSLALAARTGREAGRFELATKVTAVE